MENIKRERYSKIIDLLEELFKQNLDKNEIQKEFIIKNTNSEKCQELKGYLSEFKNDQAI